MGDARCRSLAALHLDQVEPWPDICRNCKAAHEQYKGGHLRVDGRDCDAAPALGPFEDAHQNLVAGDLSSVLLSITMGAISANTQDEQGYTLLHFAAQLGSLPDVQALLDRGADPSIKAKDGKTAADLATTPEIRAALAVALAKPAGGG